MSQELLQMYVNPEDIEWAMVRSGNPHRTKFATAKMNKEDLVRARKLASCKAGSGHDVFLNGIRIRIDWYCSQIVHRQLLRYSHLEVVSSMSLMHSYKEVLRDDFLMQRIPEHIKVDLRNQLPVPINMEEDFVDSLPMGILLGISFTINYRSAKTIYAQRHNHKRKEWRDFCAMLKTLPLLQELCLEKKE